MNRRDFLRKAGLSIASLPLAIKLLGCVELPTEPENTVEQDKGTGQGQQQNDLFPEEREHDLTMSYVGKEFSIGIASINTDRRVLVYSSIPGLERRGEVRSHRFTTFYKMPLDQAGPFLLEFDLYNDMDKLGPLHIVLDGKNPANHGIG